jgi:hypothetical protein
LRIGIQLKGKASVAEGDHILGDLQGDSQIPQVLALIDEYRVAGAA